MTRHPQFFCKGISLLFFCALLVASCSKGEGPIDPEEPAGPSPAKNMSSFAFLSSENPGLGGNCYSRVLGDTQCVTVPLGVPLTSLTPNFTLSDKAKAEIDGKPVVSGATTVDWAKLVKMKITAEDGSFRYYYINVQNGIRQLDDLVYDFMEKYSIPGISVSVAYKEKLVYAKGFGYADKDTHERLEADYMLRLASCSKPLTSLCIMRLMEEGKLSLTDRPFAPGGVLYDQFPIHGAAFEQMTIRNFLEHTSGMTNNPFDPMFDNSTTTSMTHLQTIDYVLKNFSPAYIPGIVHSYSNFGFCVLGRVIEAVARKNGDIDANGAYEDYLKKAVLVPAAVTDIRVGSTGIANRFPKESVYYSQSGTNGYANNMQRLDACGGMIASTPELMRLACTLDGLTDIPDIFTPNTLALMVTPSEANSKYALGWRVNHSLYPEAAYHSGNLSGTAAMWAKNYKTDTHCAILCNSRSYLSSTGGSFDDYLYVLLSNIMALGNWPSQDLFDKY